MRVYQNACSALRHAVVSPVDEDEAGGIARKHVGGFHSWVAPGQRAEAHVVVLHGRLPCARVEREQDEHRRDCGEHDGREAGSVTSADEAHAGASTVSRVFQRSLPASRRTSTSPRARSAHGPAAATGCTCWLAVCRKTLGSTNAPLPNSAAK